MLRFEKATPEDARILARVSERAFHSDVHYGAPGLGGPPGYDSDLWQIRMMTAGEYYKILVDDRIVGGIVLRLKGYQYYEVARIFIDPGFQNQGIGTQTFEFLWTEYPEVERWTLGTPAWNQRTPHFYRKVGFVEMGDDGHGGTLFDRRVGNTLSTCPLGKTQMQYRKLGRTALDVSAIGLGTEYLLDQPRETVVAVTQQAIAQGVNYFDLFWPHPTFRDNMGAAFQGYREQVLLTAHLGCIAQDDQYCLTRDPGDSETFFLDYLRRCGTDYVDVLFLHNCNAQEDYNQMMRSDGLLGLARRLQHEGKARFLGLSGHNAAIALQAVSSGQIDVLMFPINLAGHAVPGRKELLYACTTHDVGLVAMKPYAGGRLLRKERIIHVEDFQMGRTEMMGAPTSFEKPVTITPLQCLSYVLSQAGVSTTVPGCKNLGELAAALAYWQAADEEKDLSAVLSAFEDLVTGECVYCNHCLPCPSAIDIGKTLSLLDEAQQHLTAELQSAYDALPVKAASCVQCGDCVVRCPFGVDAMAKMDQAVELFKS